VFSKPIFHSAFPLFRDLKNQDIQIKNLMRNQLSKLTPMWMWHLRCLVALTGFVEAFTQIKARDNKD